MFVKGIYEICLKIPFEVDRYNCKFAKRDRKLSVFIYPLLEKEESSEKGINQFVKETNVEFENDLLD